MKKPFNSLKHFTAGLLLTLSSGVFAASVEINTNDNDTAISGYDPVAILPTVNQPKARLGIPQHTMMQSISLLQQKIVIYFAQTLKNMRHNMVVFVPMA